MSVVAMFQQLLSSEGTNALSPVSLLWRGRRMAARNLFRAALVVALIAPSIYAVADHSEAGAGRCETNRLSSL